MKFNLTVPSPINLRVGLAKQGPAGAQGQQGTQGIQGVKGDKGDKGDPGDVSTAQMNAAIAAYMQPLRPVVLTQPTAVSGNVGDSLSISCLGGILPNTHLNLTYQWQLSTDAGVSYSNITGATSPSIPFTPALFGNNGLYRCRLTNAFGTQDTNAVALTIDNAIRHLYGVNNRGVAWDLDRMDHLFQLAIGGALPLLPPVTAYGDPVGMIITRERGGIDSLGPELVTNGNFDTNANWVLGPGCTISGGQANFAVSSGFAGISQAIPSLVQGKVYRITFDMAYVSGTGLGLGMGPSGQNIRAPFNASGSYVVYFYTSTLTSAQVYFRANPDFTGSIDNISVREVLGTHLVQATSSRRPTYARRPMRGIVNLLQRTEELNNAAWNTFSSNAIRSVNAGQDPNAGNEAMRLRVTSGQNNGLAALRPSGTGNHVLSGWFKADGFRYVELRSLGRSPNHNEGGIIFDLQSGVVTLSSGGRTGTITSAGNGWWRCVVTGGTTTSGTIEYRITPCNQPTSITLNPVSNGTDGVLIWRPQLELGTVVTNYQRVTNQFDVTETGQPSINYLWFDGIDDCLQSATAIDFSNSDEMTVCVGCRTLQAAQQVLVESTLGAVNGLFGLYNWWNNGRPMFRAWGDFPSPTSPTPIPIEGSVIPLNTVTVLTGQVKLSGDSVSIRRNGQADGSASGELGNSNFVSRVVHVGSRGGSSLYLNGHLNSGFIINRILNPAILADYEKHWVAAKAGIDL